MRGKHRPEIHPADESHGKSPDGQGKGFKGMGGIKDDSILGQIKEGKKVAADQMVETYTDKMVQEVFEEDPDAAEAIGTLWEADYRLLKAREALALASSKVKGTPNEMRIDSIYEAVDKLLGEIYGQILRMGGR